jgi:release factor glutamine methyltransferase
VTGGPTWADLVESTQRRLAEAGFEHAATEARWLVEEVSGLDAAELVAEGGQRATRRAMGSLEDRLERRLRGEPLQYVLGSWSFRGLDLLVDRRVLIPRPETEVVAEIAIGEVLRLGERVGRPDPWAGVLTHYAVADLGTGSGALALALASALPDAEVWATDVSPDALAVARANLAGGAQGATRVRLAEGSWFGALPDELAGRLLVVVSNPPYVAEHEVPDLPATVVDWEPRGALVAGPTGLEAIERIVGDAPRWLDAAGTLVLETAPHQVQPVLELAGRAGFAEALVRPDLTGRDRVVVARMRADVPG